MLKQGLLKAVVCSTSLELGIDVGYIDLVAQIGSPKSVTRAVQRIGRSGHKFRGVAKGRIIVLDRDDLVECAVMLRCAKERRLDKIQIPKNCLDILAQHVVGMGLNKRSYCYHGLNKKDFIALLHYLARHHAELDDRHVYGKIWFDEKDEVFGKRGKYTRVIYYLNIGGKLYKFRFARGMRCYVESAKEAVPTIPAWFSEMLPLSFDLALEIQKFRAEMKIKLKKGESKARILSWLVENYPVDEYSANSIYEYFIEQHLYEKIPSKNEILIEKTYDLEGRKFLVFHSLFGRRTNDALSRAAAVLLSEQIKHSVGVIISDNGFALHVPRERRLNIDKLLEELQKCNLDELLKKSIRRTELMKRRFRHCAARSFLVLRNYKGYKISVSRQQASSQTLLRICEEVYVDFPVIQETYREILSDILDIDKAKEVIELLKEGNVKVETIETEIPSPFAHNLIVLGEADVILMEDRKHRLLELHEAIMRRIR